jgi:hypothetical protein
VTAGFAKPRGRHKRCRQVQANGTPGAGGGVDHNCAPPGPTAEVDGQGRRVVRRGAKEGPRSGVEDLAQKVEPFAGGVTVSEGVTGPAHRRSRVPHA